MHFNCPGCKMVHGISVAPHEKPTWTFNDDFEKPTFSPSYLTWWGGTVDKKWVEKFHVCHSFIKDGKIQFLNDCTHELKGKTVEIPDWEQ